MKIVIPGGTGQVGTVLARAMVAEGHKVVILTRKPGISSTGAALVAWDAKTLAAWSREFDDADVIINLAGRSVNCRYHATNRRQIIESRLESTRVVAEAIAAAKNPPRVWLQASTATIYAHRFDAGNDETSGILGTTSDAIPETWRFSHGVALAWEKAATDAVIPSATRLVLMRSAIVMNPDAGSAFSVLLRLVRLGLGGINGDGRQYVSWIHDRDFVRSIYWLIDHNKLAGPVNLCSPNPLPNRDFMRGLREAWGAKIGLPATKWMLEIGAVFIRTETELILKSRRVTPGKMVESGFTFEYPEWPGAAKELCARWRRT